MFERNPVWLVPLLWYGIPTVAAAVGGYLLYRNVNTEQAARDLQLQQQAELNRQQAFSSQIQSQIMIERFTPVLWATVPAMVLVGAYFLWKANQEQSRE